jgi:hypothetical protein
MAIMSEFNDMMRRHELHTKGSILMQRRSSALVRLVASATLVAAIMLGTNAFVPAAFGCGSQQGGGNCKQATTDTAMVLWIARARGLVDLCDALLP